MGDPKEKYDDNDAVCPYCGDRFQVEGEDYKDEGIKVQIECDGCKKKYYLQQEYEVSHTSTPDCGINNEEHDLVLNKTPCVVNLRPYFYCRKCNKTKVEIDHMESNNE